MKSMIPKRRELLFIKHCKDCGNSPLIQKNNKHYYIECVVCNKKTCSFGSINRAIKVWNSKN